MKNGNGNDFHGKVEVVNVSPTQAARWLSNNGSNRPLRATYIEALARDMREGRWRFNGAAIRLSNDGRLIDGQHRLSAVILSGLTIPLLIVRELDFDIQETIDIGAVRTAADTLKLRGGHNTSLSAAIARKVILWGEGKRWHFSNYKPTNPQIVELAENDPRLTTATEMGIRYRNSIPIAASVTGFTWYILSNLNPGAADQFFEQVSSGINLDAGDPALTLRNRLVGLRRGNGSTRDEQLMGAIFRAWNAAREGRKLYKLPLDTTNFPEPIK